MVSAVELKFGTEVKLCHAIIRHDLFAKIDKQIVIL